MQHNTIIIQDHNKETVKNVEDININHTQYLDDSIAHFYQKKEDCNLILTNETKFMNPGFGIEFMNILFLQLHYKIMYSISTTFVK